MNIKRLLRAVSFYGQEIIKLIANTRFKGCLPKVKLTETFNPVARGFRALKIEPKTR